MQSKTCVITGANAGLGYETALALAAKDYQVFMVCRSEARGAAARESILQQVPNGAVHLTVADLASQKAVYDAAMQIQAQTSTVDVLINNAALVSSYRQVSKEGLEMQFAVNHLSHFLLTHLLLPSLQAAPESRIVNVSSANHFRGKIHFDDPNLERNYKVLRAYNQSKLANVLFTYEMDRKLKAQGITQISSHAVDPGLNDTGIGQKNASWLHGLVWRFRRKQGQSPKEGAKNQIYVASAPEVSGLSGKYWVKQQSASSAPLSYIKEDAKKLWELSLELTGLKSDSNAVL